MAEDNELGEWHAIETAPKDGSVVLLLMSNGVRVIADWWPGSRESPEPEWSFSIVGIAADGKPVFFHEWEDSPPIHWRRVPEDWADTHKAAYASMLRP